MVQQTFASTVGPTDDIIRLVRLADALGAAGFGGPLSVAEHELLTAAESIAEPDAAEIHAVASAIHAGADPLGERLTQARTPIQRRPIGQFLTPAEIVQSMVSWALARDPGRVVDVGAGSGRFAAEVGRQNPCVETIAIDLDPVACLLCRAHLSQVGSNATVICGDYLTWLPERAQGATAYIGNPPYVRHHALSLALKRWLDLASAELGQPISKLAGLHAYFIIATALKAAAGDLGCFVTSSEWLDVKYGSTLRWLFVERLGISSIHLLATDVAAFQEAMTTAVITCYRIGIAPNTIRAQKVDSLSDFRELEGVGHDVPASALSGSHRWSGIIARQSVASNHNDFVPLRDIARVHRGVATGANQFFILSTYEAEYLGIREFCIPCITRAEQIIRSDGVIREDDSKYVLMGIPSYLDTDDMPLPLRAYLKFGEDRGIDQAYLCRHRKPWWSLGKIRRPPIVMTYMARRPPVFALNPDRLALVNIAHGIHPLVPMSEHELRALVRFLNDTSASFSGNGRTYHGGLEKFEPSEVEALLVPSTLALAELATPEATVS